MVGGETTSGGVAFQGRHGRRRWLPKARPTVSIEVKRLSIHCHPEAAAAAPRMSMLAQIKRRGGGRRRTPQLQAGKGGGIPPVCDTRPPPFPASRLGGLRRPSPPRLI